MSKFESEKYVTGKQLFDGVIEAVRYSPDGHIDFVRIYERRGPTFSDHLLISRDILIQRLKKGMKFVVGKRLPYLGTTFKTGTKVNLSKSGSDYAVSTSGSSASHDKLEGVPVI